MRISSLVLVSVVANLLLQPTLSAACEEHAKHGLKVGGQKDKAKAELVTDSLYHSDTKWKNPSAQDVRLSDFRGQKVIMTMAYTSCTYTCPLVIAKLKEVETALVAKGIKDYRIVIASFDPVRDNPQRLAEYMKEKKLNSSRWNFLSPHSDSDVREVAALLGVTYSKDKSGEYAHSNIITFLNGEGVIQDRLNGIAADHSEFVAKVAGQK